MEIPIIDLNKIPKGLYCYEELESGGMTPCPYYSRLKEFEEGGYCALEGFADWHDAMGLLWDGIKSCNHNLD